MLLLNNIPGGSAAVRVEVLAAAIRQDVWEWATRKVAEGDSGLPWTDEDLRGVLLEWIVAASGAPELVLRLRYSAEKLGVGAGEMWRRLADERSDDLQSLLGVFAADSALATLMVPKDIATQLYLERVSTVSSTTNEAQAVAFAALLDPGNWMWRDVDRYMARKALRPIAYQSARRRELQALVRPFWEEWGQWVGR